MSVLKQICIDKEAHIEVKMGQIPLNDIKAMAKDCPSTRSFQKNITDVLDSDIALIAEVKKASPSKGIIRADFNPVKIAKSYEEAGATCLSVLTDVPYFQGDDEYIKAVRDAVTLPILRKDFMIDAYQIYESRALGADCILLIVAALEDSQMQDLYGVSKELGMDVLVETHDAEELERAIAMSANMIGVNNRNLKTLDVSLQTSKELYAQMPAHVTKISESGIYTNDDILSLKAQGFDGFLVGESLMKQDDIVTATRTLLGQ